MKKAKSLKRQTGQEVVEFISYHRDKSNEKDVTSFDKRIKTHLDGTVHVMTGQKHKGQDLSIEVLPGNTVVRDAKNTLHVYSAPGFATQYDILPEIK